MSQIANRTHRRPERRGLVIESIEPTRAEVRPDRKDLRFSEGGPRAWFVVVRRAG
jgi:hypothetical protein